MGYERLAARPPFAPEENRCFPRPAAPGPIIRPFRRGLPADLPEPQMVRMRGGPRGLQRHIAVGAPVPSRNRPGLPIRAMPPDGAGEGAAGEKIRITRRPSSALTRIDPGLLI